MADTFTFFGKLPTELRLKIWEFAIPGPRAIYLERVECEDDTAYTAAEDEEHDSLSVSGSLEEGTTTAENTDPDTLQEERINPETLGEEMGQSPFGNVTAGNNMSSSGESGNGDEESEIADGEFEHEGGLIPHHGHPTAFRADCSPPSLLFACHESRAIASKYYQKTFATPHAPAQTYFDFDRDTIYVQHDEFSPYASYYSEFEEDIVKVRKGGLMMVKKLAILVDAFTSQSQRSNEEMVADLLNGVFPRLDNLTIVLEATKRFPGDESPTCFIDPIDYKSTIETYENFVEDNDDLDAWSMLGDFCWLDSVEIDPESLERIILQRSRGTGDLLPLIPKIDFKVAVTGFQAEHLEKVRANIEEILKSKAEAG